MTIEAVLRDVKLPPHEPFGVRRLPFQGLPKPLSPDDMLLCLPLPEFLWGVDRLRIESFVSPITPKIGLGFELGRRPD
jgi:hypothetical protein